jgi:hypothetical protein
MCIVQNLWSSNITEILNDLYSKVEAEVDLAPEVRMGLNYVDKCIVSLRN